MGIAVEAERALAAKFEVLFPHLDERQRRLVAGAEARALGHRGIRVVARAAGMREGTVSRGTAELEAGEEPLGRVRRPGTPGQLAVSHRPSPGGGRGEPGASLSSSASTVYVQVAVPAAASIPVCSRTPDGEQPVADQLLARLV
jgi:hypothetical protein